VGAPQLASATTLTVTGGPGLDGGALCPSGGVFCPGTPDLALGGTTNPLSGSFTYNPTLNELSFDLTLTQAVTFSGSGGSETFEPGTTFTATDVVVSAPTGSGGTVSASDVAGGAAATLYYVTSSSSTQQQLVDSSIFLASLSCQTLGASRQCGVILGEAGSNELAAGPVSGENYGGVLDLNVSVNVVPLPGAVWLLISGLGGLIVLSRAASAARVPSAVVS
jgi:hypothetical protein